MFSADFLGSGPFANELYVYNIDLTVQGVTVSYVDSRLSGKAGFQFSLCFRRAERTYYTRGLGRTEDSRVEEASVVLHSLSHGEGFGGLDLRWVDRVRSGRLTETLMRILAKLAMALETGMGGVLGRGRELALRASSLAVGRGTSQAYAWRYDKSYALALGVGYATTARPGRS